ncbi:c-type cytochrome [Thiocystis violacea]|uniref:c-type cytochrome n=1 Tax=Thiocystis violacea TaxID=13725 RepID=UPI0019084884|nr:cytochrome c [Thiocystis violacea]MBK1720645.1 green heme protein [Thiocystis violacea]
MHTQSTLAIALSAAVVAFGLLPNTSAAAEEVDALYQENCTKCHGSEVYTREDRKVTSYDGLVRQVQRCELSLQLTWFDDDIKNVADYLNQRFYHFQP